MQSAHDGVGAAHGGAPEAARLKRKLAAVVSAVEEDRDGEEQTETEQLEDGEIGSSEQYVDVYGDQVSGPCKPFSALWWHSTVPASTHSRLSTGHFAATRRL